MDGRRQVDHSDDTQQLLGADLPDTASQTEQESKPWYHSPLFDKPVIGYYNRATQSNLSLNLPFSQSAPAYQGQGRTDQWVSAIDSAQGQSQVGPGSPWTGLADMANTQQPSHPSKGHHIGDQGIYSELYSPWLEGWPNKEHEKASSAGGFLQNGAGDLKHADDRLSAGRHSNGMFHHYSNGGFLHSVHGSVDGVSGDHPQVLKPEEYLSGLQADSAYSIEYAHAPCGRCSRLVTSLLVLMGLAIVALAAALTVSVLTKKDPTARQGSVEGYPVARAAMTLKILNKNYTAGMAVVGSDEFYSVAAPYSTELDRLFLLSPLADVYRGNKVTSLGPGSIKTRAELLFLDTGKVQNSSVVQNVISSAERASQWEQSDAREIGQFVVCADCVTIKMDFTRVRKLPPRPVLQDGGSSSATSSPAGSSGSTDTQGSSPNQPGDVDFGSTTVTAPNVVLSNTTPFLSDGHFVIACDVKQASEWSILTLEFKPDNFTAEEPVIVLVTLGRKSPAYPEVAEKVRSRIFAFPTTSSEGVSLVVNVTSVTCADRGEYRCRVRMKDGREYDDGGRVGILELPTIPVIKETKSAESWEATPVYSCSAKLGYPPGKLTLSIADKSGFNLRPISGHVHEQTDCEAATEVQVSSLDSGLLGNASRLVCQLFSEHLQLLDSTEYSVSHEIVLTSKLEIQTKSASINDGLAAIRCRLLFLPKWTRLILQRMTSEGQVEEVVSMTSDGKMQWTDFRLRHRTLVTSDVKDTLAEFSIFIFSLKCYDEALYSCAVEAADVEVTSPVAYLNVTAKPTKPELTVPLGVRENAAEPFPVTCKAKVGRPAGKLVLTAQHQNEADHRELTFNEQTSSPLSCTTEVRGIFHADAGALRNGSSVSCHVVPDETLRSVVDQVSTSTVVNILPENICKGNQDTIPYPGDCRHFIHCKDDVMTNVSTCPDELCFNADAGTCSIAGDIQKESRCPQDIDFVTIPHPDQCSSYIQCEKGKENIKHCPSAQLYVTDTQCSTDVTETHCYKTLDLSVWLVTNATDVP